MKLRRTNWTLRTRVTMLTAGTAVVLGIIAVTATVVAMHNRSETDRLVNRETPALFTTQRLLTALVDQETGIRGYAVNAQPADRAPYDRGVGEEATAEATLHRLLDDRSELADQVRQIQSLTAAWRADVAAPVIAAMQAGDRTRAQAGISDGARSRFDEIRDRVGRLQDRISVSREATVQAVNGAGGRLVDLLIAAALVIVLAGIMLAVLLRYLVIGPVAGWRPRCATWSAATTSTSWRPRGRPRCAGSPATWMACAARSCGTYRRYGGPACSSRTPTGNWRHRRRS